MSKNTTESLEKKKFNRGKNDLNFGIILIYFLWFALFLLLYAYYVNNENEFLRDNACNFAYTELISYTPLVIAICLSIITYIFYSNYILNLSTHYIKNEIPKETLVLENDIDVLEQIKKIGELKESGFLTEEEFNSKKAELLKKL